MKRPKGSICGYSLETIQKLLANVKLDPQTGCWEWQGGHSCGYGAMWAEGDIRYAHRVAYEIFCGEIVGRLSLDHLCGNPGCANPAHLEPVGQSENVARSIRKGAKYCKRGHSMRGANLLVQVEKGKVRRRCRACTALGKRVRYRKKRLREGAARADVVTFLGSIDEGFPEVKVRGGAA